MEELDDAINESFPTPTQIAEVVSRIKEDDYDIFLVLEATQSGSASSVKIVRQDSLVATLSSNPEFKINDQDMKSSNPSACKIEEER